MSERNIDKYPHSFSALKIKNLIFSNRFVGTPMVNIPTHILLSSTDYGSVSLWDRSLGGLGAVALEYHSKARNGDNQYEANGGDPFCDKYSLDVIREQLTVAKQAGALTEMVMGLGCFYQGKQYSPSGTDFGRPIEVRKTEEITEEILLKLIKEAALKAKHAKDFGFDYIGVDMSGDNLCALFMAPGFNKRTDKYGGSYENRFKVAKMLINEIRKQIGNDTVLEVKISGELGVKETYPFDEMLKFLKEEENEIDIVSVSKGMDEFHDGAIYSFPVSLLPHKQNALWGKIIKEQTKIKVNLVGSISTIEDSEDVLAGNCADLVLLGRSMIADPYWIKKVIEGKEEDIVPCLRCNNCIHTATKHRYVACSVNPRYRRENRVPLQLPKAERSKNVVIIGAGPAGIKAALTAKQRGHNVTLIEKESEVGGLLNVASKGELKKDLLRYNNYLKTQLKKSGVNLMLNTTADRQLVKSLCPDNVIIAVGAKVTALPIKGIENCIQAVDLIKNDLTTDKENIVILGGGSVGCELALELAHQNKNVTILEKMNELALNSNSQYRDCLLHLVAEEKRIKTITAANCIQIDKNSLLYEKNGEEIELLTQSVVLATGFKNDVRDIEQFFDIGSQTAYVGDCHRVANVLEATNDAYFVAASI